jgi:hypothetical protein
MKTNFKIRTLSTDLKKYNVVVMLIYSRWTCTSMLWCFIYRGSNETEEMVTHPHTFHTILNYSTDKVVIPNSKLTGDSQICDA